MRKQLLLASAITAGLIGFVGAPIASADEAGFLNELRANGFGDAQMPDGVAVANGWMACNRLHLGEKPEQTLALLSPNDVEKGRMLINAAQHNLCPDTL